MPGSPRGDDGGYIPQPKAYEYNPPSVFARHRVLSILFGGAILILLIYWFAVVRKMPVGMYIPPDTSVYIEDLSAASAVASPSTQAVTTPPPKKP